MPNNATVSMPPARRRRLRNVVGVIFVSVCAMVVPSSATATIVITNPQQQQVRQVQDARRLDAWALIDPNALPNWLNGSIDDEHGVESLAYGDGWWMGFASSNLPAPQNANSNAFATRFSINTFENTRAWIDLTLRKTTHSISAVASGGGQWVAWADPRKVNAGEFHAVRRTADSFKSWAVDNANAGCFSTSFAFGQDDKNEDIFYGVCNPKLMLKDDSIEVKPAFNVQVLGSISAAFDWMKTSLAGGFTVKALVYGQGKFVAYSEQRFIPVSDDLGTASASTESLPVAVFGGFPGSGSKAVFEWIKANQGKKYDLTAVSYSTKENMWLAYMELPDPRHVSVHKTCSYGCPLAYIGDGQCDSACNNELCENDGQDCDPGGNNPNPDEIPSAQMCRPGCEQSAIGDGFCDPECEVEGCDFDGGDCECAKGCRHVTMVGDSNCDVVCDVEACGFDGGDCLAGGFAGSSVLGNKDPGTNPTTPLFFIDSSGLEDMLSAQDAAATRESINNATALWSRGLLTRHKPIVFSDDLDASDLSSCNFEKGFKKGDKIEASIFVKLVLTEIDGKSGVRARAGPCAFDRTTELPRIGTLQLDMADLDDLLQGGFLKNIIAHELGHIIGVGSEWGRQKLIEGRGTIDPRYRGDGGRAGLLRLGGSGLPELANTGGKGRYELHWRESVFDDELMTGKISSGTQPLSLLTLMSLHDLGYLVDLTVAQTLTLTKPEEENTSVGHKDAIGSFGSDVIDGATVIINVIGSDGVVYVREPGKKDVLPGQTYLTFPPASIAAISIAGVLFLSIVVLVVYSHLHPEKPSARKMVTGAMSNFTGQALLVARAFPRPKNKVLVPKEVTRHSHSHSVKSAGSMALPRAETLGSGRGNKWTIEDGSPADSDREQEESIYD